MILKWIALIVFLSCGNVQSRSSHFIKGQLNDFAFEDIFPNKFPLKGFNGTWITETELLYKDAQRGYSRFNAETKEVTSVLTAAQLSKYKNPTVQIIGDNFEKILIRYDVRTIFRHSTISKYAIFDAKTGKYYDVAKANDVQICKVSPVGNSLVYVMDNNVFYRPSLFQNNEIKLTEDGVPGVIYNGVPDWVYEEEVFGTDATLWYSPDGMQIAMASFDDTNVKEFSYHMYGESGNENNQYPSEFKIRYPKVNTTNPLVKLSVKDFRYNNSKWVEIDAPLEVTKDHVLGRVTWINNDRVGAVWLNRRQNVGSFQSCETMTGYCIERIPLAEPEGWIDLSEPICTTKGERCFMLNNRNGWRKIVQVLENGTISYRGQDLMTIISINGYDDKNDHLYYTAVPSKTPHHRHFYRDSECLSCNLLKDKFNNNEPCTFSSFSLSKNFMYFASTCSGPGPSYSQIFRTEDLSPIYDWEMNIEKREDLKQYKETQIKYLSIPVEGNFSASVRLYLPPEVNFENPSRNNKKYPMIVQVYGGPNSVRVQDAFAIGYHNYLTTTGKIIYCQIDGRGTGNKGTKMLFSINNKLGTHEMADQIAVAKDLQKRFSFIDPKRTAIWGWSYGGYATAMTLEKDASNVFKCGISVAPVTSWMFYDSIYTERYMGLPREDDNLNNYLSSDVSKYIDGMKHHKYMIIHGNADDNVHYQQSMVFIGKLVREDIDFEQMSYPDENHSLGGVQKHLYHTINQFWGECFEQQLAT